MKTVKIGSSIKTYTRSGKEKFLTVESVHGDIGLFRGCTLVAKRERKDDDTFTYNNETFRIIS